MASRKRKCGQVLDEKIDNVKCAAVHEFAMHKYTKTNFHSAQVKVSITSPLVTTPNSGRR